MREFSLIIGVIFCLSLGGHASSYQSYKLNGKDTINIVDINGKKQGYWIINGSMRNLPEYKAEDIIEEGSYQNSRRIGFWKKYFPGNKLKSNVEYKNGRPNGDFTIYYENGQVEEQGNWSSSGRGKYTGNFKRYYPNGNIQQEKKFGDDGKTNGTVTYFHENGEKELEYEVVAGVESGMMRRYYADGTLKEEKMFNNGVVDPASIKKYEPKAPELAVIEEEPPAPVVHEDVVEDKEAKPNIGEIKCNGHNKLFNRNRQVTQDGVWKKCKFWEGKWHKYDSNGLEIAVEIWKRGRYVGDGVIEKD